VPELPERIAGVAVSTAYRSCVGLAAGGDFLDVIALDEARVAVIVGDVAGHDRESVIPTALVHYTVRAYVAAGLEPRDALRLTDRAVQSRLGSAFTTVLVAIYDGEESTLRYATAGHPVPIVVGEPADHAVAALTPPPIGLGPRMGFRQTEIGIPPGARICLFTDGLTDLTVQDGQPLGRDGVRVELERLGDAADAAALLELLTHSHRSRDDVTVCLLDPSSAASLPLLIEDLDLDSDRARDPALATLLEARGLGPDDVARATAAAVDVTRAGPARLTLRCSSVGASWTVDPVGSRTPPGRTEDAQLLSQFVHFVPNRI
jgi:hypothetical protein